jgi:hypothetical protein
MISFLDRPSAVRRPPYAMGGGCQRKRTTTARWSAALACRFPPRFSRCRPWVLPDEAGMGHAPHNLARAASDRIRSALSPAVTSSSAAMSGPMPKAATSSGAAAFVSFFRRLPCSLISS